MKQKIIAVITVVILSLVCLCACAVPGAENDLGSVTDEGYDESLWVDEGLDDDPDEITNPNSNQSNEILNDLPDNSEDNNAGQESNPPNDTTTQYETYIIANSSSLNIRSGAGTSYSKVGTMDKGDMLCYLGQSGSWYKTIYKEKIAYVSNSYSSLKKLAKSDIEGVENTIEIGKTLLGYPYIWGSQRYHWGNGVLNKSFVNGEFDCSALMQYIYYKGADVLLDVNTRTQVVQGKEVKKADIQRGDLLFFTNSSRYNNTGVERIGHVAMYLGDNYILHTASDFAVIEQISTSRWNYYITARRVIS